MKQLIKFLKEQNGATAVEYAIMVSVIAMVIFIAVTTLGLSLVSLFENFNNRMGWS